MDCAPEESQSGPISRRRAIRWLSVCAAGGFGAVAATGCGDAGSEATTGTGQRPAPDSATTPPAPVRLALADIPAEGRRVVWLGDVPVEVRRRHGEVEARSLLCTHFGCPVHWDEAKAQYACPCHNGMFDASGEVIGGPPLKPLRRVQVARSGADVIVGAKP
jgi:cytochrome b6-f complex iron-sulfur subunit